MPRGRGFATATTSAALLPNYEQRNRDAKSLSVVDPPTGQRLGVDLSHGAASAAHSHEELAETVVELLDVSEHAHGRMVRTGALGRPCSAGASSDLYGARDPFGPSVKEPPAPHPALRQVLSILGKEHAVPWLQYQPAHVALLRSRAAGAAIAAERVSGMPSASGPNRNPRRVPLGSAAT